MSVHTTRFNEQEKRNQFPQREKQSDEERNDTEWDETFTTGRWSSGAERQFPYCTWLTAAGIRGGLTNMPPRPVGEQGEINKKLICCVVSSGAMYMPR